MKPLFEKETIYELSDIVQGSWELVKAPDSDKLMICSKADHVKHQSLLEKIAGAIRFNESSLVILDLDKSDYFPISRLIGNLQDKLVLSFGILPEHIGLPNHLKGNQIHQFETFKYCVTYKLDSMAIDQNKKKVFWSFAKSNLV